MIVTKEAKAMLRAEYEKVWDSEKMVNYCVNKNASYAELTDGRIITVEKRKIETRFCFGESGYDYDDAARMAQHARTSEEYFKRRNMEDFVDIVKTLTEELNNDGHYVLVIYANAYYSQTEDCRLASCGHCRFWEVIDACGGSVKLEELPDKVISIHGRECRVASKEDIRRILEAYKEATKAHEKKVDAYLKRYGTSKVYSWTYWRDA